jgi:Zn-dependent metalloprotease
MSCHHSLYCVIPPHILQNIIENGTQAQRQQALRNIVSAEAMRLQREAAAKEATPSGPATPEAMGPTASRAIYTAENAGNLPGRLIRSEGQPATGDTAADEAYDGAGATFDLYQQVFGRNSIDGQGMRLDSTVHFRVGYDNAFWNGRQMVYGDGDEDLPEAERLFNRFTIALDIIGHELAHGVTQFTANMVYQGQPGALNESMSDVFGSLVKQRTLGQPATDADWIIGSGLFTPNVSGVGIRSMKAPGTAYNDTILGKDPQPGHMRDYVQTSADNGGVHINSGIPNRAFYVTAVTLGGFAWEKAGRIWYHTLQNKMGVNTQFAQAAFMTYEAAGELFGAGSVEQQAVRAGWADVGIDVQGGGPPPGDNGRPGCAGTLMSLMRAVVGPR